MYIWKALLITGLYLFHKPPPHDLTSQLLDLDDTEFSSAGFGDPSSDDEPDGSLGEGSPGSIGDEEITVESRLRVSFIVKNYVFVLRSFRDWNYWQTKCSIKV